MKKKQTKIKIFTLKSIDFIYFIEIEQKFKSIMLKKSHNNLILVLLIFSVLHQTHSIKHQQQTKSLEDLEYNKLNQQQKSLQGKINSLLDDISNVQRNVSLTPSPSEKVLLLERAVISERQKVFDMQNLLIPPFSFSKTACLELTNEQKIQMLDKIKNTKNELTVLQQQIVLAPKCDKVSGLQKDTQKQLALLQSLQKTIRTECESKSILSPTIYQTNIYSDGWILGDQNIDDLIEEYYQRNIRYHNITNCPLQKPFFNGKQCVICTNSEPVFNILTRECTHCPQDQQPDSNLRQCVWQPHFTNFSSVDNWAQEGQPMPVPKKQLIACPPQRPYYNGKKCQVCLMPKYWSIKRNACVQCPVGMVFDVNDHRCEIPETNQLTILQGTRWVTNDCNLTRIVEDRIKILNLNKTAKTYKMCPPDKPYYDGIVCLSCPNEFNIDTRKCVTPPNRAALFDQNVRCYVQKQVGFQTDPRASNYTTKRPLTDTTTPNCKKATPYYDGIACIDCLDPFPIFDVDTKRCIACDPMQIYNDAQHKCNLRQKIYFSTNENRLMATPKMSIDDYHAEVSRKVKQNPQAIVMLCQPTEYSDYTKCLNCSATQYFNVQTKKCQICDGSLNNTTKICAEKTYIYTNLNPDSVKRIVAIPTTIQQQNATINNNLKVQKNSKLCPANQPYFDGGACSNCTKQSYNMTSQKCVPMICTDPRYPFYNAAADKCEQCPKNYRYVEKNKKCEPIAYVTNTNAIFFYIEEQNATKATLEDKIFELQKDHAVITCDASHPYFNGTDCIDCAITRNEKDAQNHKPYFNLFTLKCQACNKWDNVTHKCLDVKGCKDPTPLFDKTSNKCVACPPSTVFNPSTGKCEPCPKGQQFNQKTSKCQNITCSPPTVYNPSTAKCEPCGNGQQFNQKTSKCQSLVTDITALNNNYIQEGNGTKANLKAEIQKLKASQNVQVCPKQAPFYSKTQLKCINCGGQTPYFDILTSGCVGCKSYNTEIHQCEQEIPRFKMNVEDFYGTIFQ